MGVALALDTRRLKPKAQSITASKGTDVAAFAVASDWHIEEHVDPRSVNGLNEFNLSIASQRIDRFTQSVLRLVEIERGGADVETLVLILGGDLMTGYIHEELQETNELSPTQTILFLMERLATVIETLRSKGNFKRILIPCSYGNHGRNTKKPRHATGAANNYEWLLYHILAKRFSDGVEWQIADSYHNFLDIFGKTIRIHHGDGLAYQGGIGGLTIPVEKAIASWNKARVAELDVFGHWHTQQQNPKWISNGSLIGHNAYSIAIKAPFEPPQQTFFLFSATRGRTVTAPIFLT